MSMKSKWNRKVIALLSALLVLLPYQSASAGTAPPSGSKLPGYAHEIKSLKGEDYSDLAYLKPLLATTILRGARPGHG
ncbi:hypothetical protein J7E73_19980 [Paenibacillus albidus]|uniref:hypothetical protein n=1 Tax=Paenibacillus albidus TaxID=2041023 RepID=UPI001BE6031F|nr:hypothetical protein [Paenibacillus albidus]MBT2291358.1 hypothetical protein [Paenibacillus albidus]